MFLYIYKSLYIYIYRYIKYFIYIYIYRHIHGDAKKLFTHRNVFMFPVEFFYLFEKINEIY